MYQFGMGELEDDGVGGAMAASSHPAQPVWRGQKVHPDTKEMEWIKLTFQILPPVTNLNITKIAALGQGEMSGEGIQEHMSHPH
jgi:hypothetical protein